MLGWSLGGMVALELARTRPTDLAALVLVATTPRFLEDADWAGGMAPAVLQGFAAGLAQDYRRTISNFCSSRVSTRSSGVAYVRGTSESSSDSVCFSWVRISRRRADEYTPSSKPK